MVSKLLRHDRYSPILAGRQLDELYGSQKGRKTETIRRVMTDVNEKTILLCTYGSGGEGFNFSSFSMIYLLDRTYNPQVEVAASV
jgi:hypothetical protein